MVAGAEQVLQAAAAMYGVQVDVEKTSHFFPPWRSNSPAMLAHAMGEWKEMGRGEDVIPEPNGQFGTDDVFFLMQQVVRNGGQALYMVLASDDDKGRMRNIHDPEGRFDLAPELMDAGVELATRVLRRMGGSA
jgi:metal-dependent amidase/aminoacylase/carboxypeptidase family protein